MKKKTIKKNYQRIYKKDGFNGRSKNVTFRFRLCYDLHNS